ncbi:membrane-associated protein, putative [Bodo saltans]|uniref:Membrane-associated protein, putative n=1 Tax=Bodo saltans TaxID=75058 RepID=A0A0S4J144_BODSA|nr:membrane-associated protein, putative [Bodo saltans]|eukprot:CUG46601.1 membrane-associated protein, putative [Bodo saltans]
MRNKAAVLWRVELLLFTAILCLYFINGSSREPSPDLLEVVLHARKTSLPHLSRIANHLHVPEFRWFGGGVRGATEGEDNVNLDINTHRNVLQEFETAFGKPAAKFESLNRSTYTQHSLFTFVTFFTSKVALNTNPDCAARLHPSQQLLCHVWAAQRQRNIKHKNSGSHGNYIPKESSSLFKESALHSMCSLLLACAEWKRGRYSVPLSNALLQSTFDKVANDHELLNASEVLLRKLPYGSELLRLNFRHWPVNDRSKSRDMILAIYPTHDELFTFQSLMPYSVLGGAQFVRTNESVNTYFAAITSRRAAKLCNKTDESPNGDNRSDTFRIEQNGEEALFYLVFLSDSITSRSRTDALAPCVLPAQPIVSEFPPKDSHNFNAMKDSVSRGLTLVHDPPVPSLRSLGARIPMHVISANIWELHESPTTYEWLMRMATGNCNVTTAPLRGDEWRFGEHPTSDVTHLYRASTVLWVPPHARSRRRHSPMEFKEPSRRPPLSAGPPTGPREVARLGGCMMLLRT